MHFFMDESGQFTPSDGISVVSTLAVPSRVLRRLRAEIELAGRSWPRVNGELKSGSMTGPDLKRLIDILFQYEAVLHSVAINVKGESKADIDYHKKMQCEGITKHITPEHYPAVVEALWRLRRTLEGMPQQLYIQSVAMRELVCTALEEVAIYFSQRRPREIARFDWIIDAKDPTRISTQEQWWRETLGPLVERRSMREGFKLAKGQEFKFKHFKHSFRMVKDQWYPDKPRERRVGLNIRKMLMEHVSFVDSRDDVLIQAADVLTGNMRRALSGKIVDPEPIRQLGRLQILRRRGSVLQSVQFISLSDSPEQISGLMPVMKTMAKSSRPMLARVERVHGF